MTDNTDATGRGDRFPPWIAYLAWAGALAHTLAICVLTVFGGLFLSDPTEHLGIAGKAAALIFFVLCFVGFLFFLSSGYAAEAIGELTRTTTTTRADNDGSERHSESGQGPVVALTTITSELARQFRHIASVGATSSFLALMGVFASALKSPVFQALFFGVAALPLVALSINPIREVFVRKDASEPAGEVKQAEKAPKVG